MVVPTFALILNLILTFTLTLSGYIQPTTTLRLHARSWLANRDQILAKTVEGAPSG